MQVGSGSVSGRPRARVLFPCDKEDLAVYRGHACVSDAPDAGRVALVGVAHPTRFVENGASEAHSWGVGEDESGDGLYCGFEGVVGAAVIGV